MLRLKRWGLGALLILLGLEILTFAPKRLGSPQEAEMARASKDVKSAVATTSQIMHGVHLVETGGGRKEWELDSDNAQGFKDKGTWKLQGVHVKFFSLPGTVYTVTGKTGSIQTETKDMEVQGDVVTTTSDGYVFKSQYMQYSSKDKTLTTPEFVAITGPKEKGLFELSGKGFKAFLVSNIMDLHHDVEAVKSIDSQERQASLTDSSANTSSEHVMNIKSVRAHINGKTGDARFEENVQVDIEQVRMTGNQADFEFDTNDRALTSLFMQGNVRVTDQDHWASSQYAQVLFKTNEFILYGNPRVIQNNNELRGEEIRFLKGGKEVRVSKARARVENKAPKGSFTKGSFN
jgi:LPS export ABC transporter protein LptC